MADLEKKTEANTDGEHVQRFQILEDIARELSGDIIFPTCFDAAVHIRKALQNPKQSIDQIAEEISIDPLICAKLIFLANSVAYNPSNNPVRLVRDAVNRLGLDVVRNVAMAIAMNQLLRSRDMVAFSALNQHLWQHTLYVANAAYVLAHRLTHINPDEAMLAGLVHDIGAFYMLYRAAQYEDLRQDPDTLKELILEWHENIGVLIISSMGLSDDIITAVQDHDILRPIPAEPKTMADLVYVGNLMSKGLFDGSAYDETPPEVGAPYLAHCPEIEQRTQIMQSAFA